MTQNTVFLPVLNTQFTVRKTVSGPIIYFASISRTTPHFVTPQHPIITFINNISPIFTKAKIISALSHSTTF